MKTTLKTHPKKAVSIIVLYLVVKWAVILLFGSYLHSLGLTQYWYALIPIFLVCGGAYYHYKKRKPQGASLDTLTVQNEDNPV